MSSIIFKRILSGTIALLVLCGLGYFAFFAKDKNFFVMKFMSSMGLHPDPNSNEFTVLDGLIRLGINIGVIGSSGLLFLVAIGFLLFALKGKTSHGSNSSFPHELENL